MFASSSVAAWTRTILAPGAIACAHWTSSAVSTPQPSTSPDPDVVSAGPSTATKFSVVGLGIPKAASKLRKFLSAREWWYASTITIVWPVPSSCERAG